MNAAQLAARVQMAALPEGEYGLMHALLGHLDLAYPEVSVGLRLKASPQRGPVTEAGWTVIECRPDLGDLRRGLQEVVEAYQAKSEQTPTEALMIPLNKPEEPAQEQSSPDSPLTVEALISSSTLPSMDLTDTKEHLTAALEPMKPLSSDLEEMLIHYLGTHLLRVVRHAPTDVASWWTAGLQSPELQGAVARAARILHGQAE